MVPAGKAGTMVLQKTIRMFDAQEKYPIEKIRRHRRRHSPDRRRGHLLPGGNRAQLQMELAPTY